MDRCLNCGYPSNGHDLCKDCYKEEKDNILKYCEECQEYYYLNEGCSCQRPEENSCDFCGRPCFSERLCNQCTKLKNNEEIAQCKECGTWHFKEDYIKKTKRMQLLKKLKQ